jgi:hypothetical protein
LQHGRKLQTLKFERNLLKSYFSYANWLFKMIYNTWKLKKVILGNLGNMTPVSAGGKMKFIFKKFYKCAGAGEAYKVNNFI